VREVCCFSIARGGSLVPRPNGRERLTGDAARVVLGALPSRRFWRQSNADCPDIFEDGDVRRPVDLSSASLALRCAVLMRSQTQPPTGFAHSHACDISIDGARFSTVDGIPQW
jgi:hypothetical protein